MADADRLTLNIFKTNVMFFLNKTVHSNVNSIKIGSNKVDIVNSCKFLGILIDDRLSFKNHMKSITGKIARNTRFVFYKIRSYLPWKARLNSYYPKTIRYDVIVWGSTYDCY